jgi:hypothetical protein
LTFHPFRALLTGTVKRTFISSNLNHSIHTMESKRTSMSRRKAIESVLGTTGAGLMLPVSSYAASPKRMPVKNYVKPFFAFKELSAGKT